MEALSLTGATVGALSKKSDGGPRTDLLLSGDTAGGESSDEGIVSPKVKFRGDGLFITRQT